MRTGRPPVDRLGHRYGKLLVIEKVAQPEGHRAAYWLCVCDCGNTTTVAGSNLGNGSTNSCGCIRRSRGGLWNSPEYATWSSMIARCTNPTHDAYRHYGARGIRVCQRWMDSLEAFIADVGPRPSRSHTLDRLDPNGHYEPGQVRWATKIEQMRNKRTNRILTFNGEQQCMAAWAEQFGMDNRTLHARLKAGWPTERALTAPLRITKRLKAA